MQEERQKEREREREEGQIIPSRNTEELIVRADGEEEVTKVERKGQWSRRKVIQTLCTETKLRTCVTKKKVFRQNRDHVD